MLNEQYKEPSSSKFSDEAGSSSRVVQLMYYFMLHYFTIMPFLLIFQSASIVTPALAYPLVFNNTLQEGLVRRMNAQPPPASLLELSNEIVANQYILLEGLHTFKECLDKSGFAWYPLPDHVNAARLEPSYIELWKNMPHPPPEFMNIRGTCVKKRTDAPSTGEHKEVHPCQVEFSLTDTKLYRTAFATLRDCANRQDNGKMGIAFWPLSHLRDMVTCGLVWPNMVLVGDEGARLGTCFLGPQNPIDIVEGLSPCQDGFLLNKSPFYRLSSVSYARINLEDCRREQSAVAWRGKTCITLPSTGQDPGGDGDCFVYHGNSYKEWYLGQGAHSWADILTHLTPDPLSFQF